MPYCAAPCTRYCVSSSWLTWTFSASAIASSTICVLKALLLDSVTSARCSSSSRRPSDSRWRCTSSSMTLSATGHLDELEELVDEEVARLGALAERLVAGDLLLEARGELVERVELAGDLREVVVGLGELALLDGGDGDGDLGGLALVVAAEQLRLERGGLARGERVERLVDALEQLAGAELVGDAARGVDLGAVDHGDEVEGHEVAGLGRAVDRDERAEAAAEALELLGDLVVADLDRVDRQLEARVVGQLDLGAHVDLDGEQEVAREVLLVGPLDDVGLGRPSGRSSCSATAAR